MQRGRGYTLCSETKAQAPYLTFDGKFERVELVFVWDKSIDNKLNEWQLQSAPLASAEMTTGYCVANATMRSVYQLLNVDNSTKEQRKALTYSDSRMTVKNWLKLLTSVHETKGKQHIFSLIHDRKQSIRRLRYTTFHTIRSHRYLNHLVRQMVNFMACFWVHITFLWYIHRSKTNILLSGR